MDINSRIKTYKDKLENFFEEYLSSLKGGLAESMGYTLMADGKRIRPIIMISFYELCGGKSKEIYNFAAAIEMIHTYSLIHDDLPCMDDAKIRRGKECNHLKFGESTALLAGDALLTEAFKVASSRNFSNPKNTLRCINILSALAGASGMVLGQYEDLNGYEDILRVHELKTACLFISCFEIGAVLAGADERKIKLAAEIGHDVGICFQLVDDLIDEDIKETDVINEVEVSRLISDLEKSVKLKLGDFGGDISVLERIIDSIFEKVK